MKIELPQNAAVPNNEFGIKMPFIAVRCPLLEAKYKLYNRMYVCTYKSTSPSMTNEEKYVDYLCVVN